MGYSEYPKNRYVSGTYKREDDISGFDFLRSELTRDYKGRIVSAQNLDEKPRSEIPFKRRAKTPLRFD